MSRSYHVTYKDVKSLSKNSIDEQLEDSLSMFSLWTKKIKMKVSILKQRKQNKKI